MAEVHSSLLPATGHHNMNAVCPTCSNPSDSQAQIDHLENEVQALTAQSVSNAEKMASYEEEIGRLKQQRSAAQAEAQHAKSASLDITPPRLERPAALTRFASFRYGSGSQNKLTPSPSVDLSDLQNQLAKEQAARLEAEKKVEQASGELEDLTAQLFEQANEMVASERKARSKLEERVAILEQRDKDKSRRLEKIEAALSRIERVKALLGT